MKANKTKTDGRMGMKTLTAFFALSYSLFVLVSPAGAYRVWIDNTGSTGQDWLNTWGWTDELGNKPAFPNDEWIDSSWQEITYRPCNQNPDTAIPNIAVSITNRTNASWQNLVYVADPETTFQNYDQNRLNGQLAFMIDNYGLNTPWRPLLGTHNGDSWFNPGETWVFVIQDYSNTLGLAASAFGSLGVPSTSSLSSGSIIPEPATMTLLGLGGLAMLRKRRA